MFLRVLIDFLVSRPNEDILLVKIACVIACECLCYGKLDRSRKNRSVVSGSTHAFIVGQRQSLGSQPQNVIVIEILQCDDEKK